MTAKKHRPFIATKRQFTVNLNTILGGVGTALCGLILWMVTSAMSASKETAKTVNTMSTQLPYLQHAIDTTAADVKEARATMVTRTELDNRHDRLQESIKEVKDDVKDIKVEQGKVRQELMKRDGTPPGY